MSQYPVWTRRRFVGAGLSLSCAASALARAANAPVCALNAEQEVGPYYISGELLRSNIVENRPGIPLSLRILLLDARTCKPLHNAAIDIWHCDALGLYSGFTRQNPTGRGGPPPGPPPENAAPPANHPSDKLSFLRGIQLSDTNGAVRFDTIVPGFYMGRTNHIHFKVRTGGEAAGHTYQSGHTSHTGQIFFPEDWIVPLMRQEPYCLHQIHRTTPAEDMVFTDQHGDRSIARIHPPNSAASSLPFEAEIVAAVDPTATPAAAARRMGFRPPPR
jgi:protocatechuate 3,4-dioxygenase beta subunit